MACLQLDVHDAFIHMLRVVTLSIPVEDPQPDNL